MSLEKSTYWKFLVKSRESNKLKQKEAALKIGISPQLLNRYEKGSLQPSLKALISMASAYRVTIDYLLTGKGEPHGAPVEPPPLVINDPPLTWRYPGEAGPDGPRAYRSEFISVPLVIDTASVRGPREIRGGDIESWVVVKRAWCPNPLSHTAIRVHGDSMLPSLQNGNIVGVDHHTRHPEQLVGRIVVARVDEPDREKGSSGGLTIKRLVQVGNNLDVWLLMPDNPNYAPLVIEAGREPTGPQGWLIGAVTWSWNRHD